LTYLQKLIRVKICKRRLKAKEILGIHLPNDLTNIIVDKYY
jgi:hypothetical protein